MKTKINNKFNHKNIWPVHLYKLAVIGLIYFIIFIVLSNTVLGQKDHFRYETDKISQHTKLNKLLDSPENTVKLLNNGLPDISGINHNSLREDLWVLDSTYYYSGLVADLVLYSKSCVVARDGFGNPIQIIDQRYDNNTNSWRNEYQGFRTYDENSNLIQGYWQSWNINTNEWINSSQFFLEYDESNNITLYIYQNWDTLNNDWLNAYKWLWTYNNNSYLLEGIFQKWDIGTADWLNLSRIVNTYENDEYIIKSLSQKWDSFTEIWINVEQNLYSYDVSGNCLEDISQTWNGFISLWENDMRILYEFNDTDSLTHHMVLKWNVYSSEWDNDTQTFLTYNEEGYLEEIKNQIWQKDQWVYRYRFLYTYNDEYYLINGLWQNYRPLDSTWVNYVQTLYDYDEMGNTIERLHEEWESMTEVWRKDSRYTFDFDENNNMNQEDYQRWDPTAEEWEYIYMYEYFWSLFSNITEVSFFEISIYPNPTNGIVNIELDLSHDREMSIQVVDITGKLIHTMKITGRSVQVDLSAEPAGIYLIRFNNKITHKIVLE